MVVGAAAVEVVGGSTQLELDIVDGRASNVIHVDVASHSSVRISVRSGGKDNGSEEEEKLSTAQMCQPDVAGMFTLITTPPSPSP